jgi:hypothetical protein
MSGGETSLSGYDNASQALSYTPGQEQVYLNGILLVRGDDYTATNGTSITGLAALSASDFIQVNCYNNFSVASVPTTSLTGTVSNAQLTNSSITINGNAVSLGGSVSLPGDIESVTASSPLTGGGTSGAVTIGIQSASTSQSGAVQLSDSTSTTSSVLAATPTAVKSAYDLANGAIPKTLTTTTGDIIYASGANTPARLGIGSTGQVLKVSGGVPSWGTDNSSSTWTQIATGTMSGNIVSITGITSNEIIIGFVQAKCGSGDGPISLGMNGSSGYQSWSWGSYYSTGRIPVTHYLGGDATSGITPVFCYIPNAQSTLIKPVLMVGNTGYAATYNIGGSFFTAAAINSLQIVAVASSTFSEGTYYVYGR